MNYQQYQPSERLSPFVKYLWTLESSSDDAPHSRERVFPDGCIELLFHYGDLFTKFDENGTQILQPRNFIHGQIRNFIELEATGKVGMLSVRFLAAGLHPFVDFDVDTITSKILSVSEAWPDGASLEQKIADCTDNSQRIAIVEEFLVSKLDLEKYDKTVADCVQTISDAGGNISIETLGEKFHVSPRHLERRFLKAVGLSQKVFSRIVRFNQALSLIEQKDFSTFSNVAYDGGFYDQAHFIRDFKDLTGLNPKQYFSENLEMVKFFNLG
ncbi:helix-turn-helix transcriptional regulator [Flavobacterium sp. MAH-1]|uniref:Helix-turn-helix transcriptional regulator n=1 Tax=Flavobacterium agri TaxID=2743471 RepID=A0A7Y9C6V3_9FLAO|nr:helix-turn-helix transcriptional regulator [Flavobacterium agri]NUY82486.1 helix-turn-helix transcriptional regulator [Flavobacterium agri]NYA72510.1 helix-turn-helix transcriptional regulator [Flavobacterium agri]